MNDYIEEISKSYSLEMAKEIDKLIINDLLNWNITNIIAADLYHIKLLKHGK